MIIKSRKIVALLTIAGIVASLMGISAMTTSSDQDIFFDSIKAQCGNAFSGSVEDSSNSAAYNGRKFVLHIRDCSDTQIKMPLHIDDNSSRILVLTKSDGSIKLQHDHRHADGSSDALTLYGGYSSADSTGSVTNFPESAESIAITKAHAPTRTYPSVWSIILSSEDITYQVVRPGRTIKTKFKFTDTVAHPPKAWDLSTRVSEITPAAQLLDLSGRFLALSETNDDFLRNGSGGIERTLPDRSYNGVRQVAAQAGLLMEELNAIPRQLLSYEDILTATMLQRDLELLIEAPEHHWLYFDVSPYNGGYVMSAELVPALNNIDLAAVDGVEHYLSLFKDAERFINGLATKLKLQKQRGILLPKAAIPRIREIYSGLRDNLAELIRFVPSRLEGLSADRVRQLKEESATALQDKLYPAIDLLLATLGDDYLAQAPEAAGLYQYPGGEAYYRHLIRRETSLDLTPDQIHQMGLQAMDDIHQSMQAIRQQLGFTGTAAQFHQQLRADKRFYASSPEEVERRYKAYVDRIKPRLPDYFAQQPQAPYGLKRASPMAEMGMAAGYYRGGASGEAGYYYYNGSNLDSRSMISAGFLIYHELIPGHHLHLSLVKENQNLSVYRRGIRANAFTEGWANYGAHLAREMGVLNDPYDQYGWLLSHAFIAVRLVVDTGLNHEGWSLDKASRYMLDNTFYSESEVATEVLRYSTDIQAQALGYKLGYDKILELRQTAKKALGEHFDLRRFHAAMLSSGTLTMPVLEQQIQRYIAEELKHINEPS
jgi:uncharacterized protein (DUF885 family)